MIFQSSWFVLLNANPPNVTLFTFGTMSKHILVKHANHISMTTSGQIMPLSDCLKTKGNVKIKLRDLCETLIVYFDCFDQYILISLHGIDCKQT